MQITSLQNERIKSLVKLRDDKRQRQRESLMLVEGRDEINLALSAGHRPQIVVTCAALARQAMDFPNTERLEVTRAVFEKLSVRDNPDGWLAILPLPQRKFSDLQFKEQPLIIIAESVEKPGNLGAVLRTADAAGVDAVVVCDPRVDLYAPNVVRASRGTIFSVPCIEATNQEAFDFLKQRSIPVLAATPSAQQPYTSRDLRGPVAIAVGTEDEGLTDFWMQRADSQVLIPMVGKVNSLNLSIATALIVYEAVRQRGRETSKQVDM